MIEAAVTMAVIGILAVISVPLAFRGQEPPLRDTTNRIASIFRLARSKAITRSNAYRIRQIAGDELTVEFAPQCSSPEPDWSNDATIINDIKIGDDAMLKSVEQNGAVNPNWNLCFDNRGRSDVSLLIVLEHEDFTFDGGIEVFRGGTVEVSFQEP